MIESVRAAIGDDDVAFSIKHVSAWEFNHVVASHYRRNRLFIAGDAAHRHPPANGLGSNTSMQDAYNLAWKLALVLRGTAGESLLESYDAERQPVGRQVVDRANQSVAEMTEWFAAVGLAPGMSSEEVDARLAHLFGPEGGDERAAVLGALDLIDGQFNAHGVEMGQRYTSSAVVADGSPPPTPSRDPELYYEPSTFPGSPIPHAWLSTGSENISSLDLCAYDRFTLIVGADGESWTTAAARVGDELGVALETVTVSLGCDVSDVFGDWTSRREVGDDGCVLVRPDRIVAFRSTDAVDDPTSVLGAAVRQVLAR